jgi:hypothetical protein
MREAIAAGYPWRRAQGHVHYFFDLYWLWKGRNYGFADFIRDAEDDLRKALWAELGAEFVGAHVRRRPGTRPWAWWHWDAPEPRRLIVVDGEEIDEDDPQYLTRLNLLTDEEKTLFKKYGDIAFVHITQGEAGKCEACWQDAREAAKGIGFDLDAQVLPRDTFWIPQRLVLDCEHAFPPGAGIFRESNG